MSAVGLAVYSAAAAPADQLVLLRALQDSERNVIGARASQPKAVAQAAAQLPPYDPTRLKKHGKNGQPPPIAVAKRNARERNRVKQVNNGFATLRQHIPSHVAQGYGDRGKKLSKVETLRMAVEYIRGLQRLLAEADGLDYDTSRSQVAAADSSMMIPSPTNSVYSSSTHNGSGDVLCLAGSELDEQHSAADDPINMDEDADPESYLLDEDEEDEGKERREAKRFREDSRVQSRLSENQNRERSLLGVASRRRRNSPGATYYVSRQSASFGDEENIEPPGNLRNNNNTTTANNNNNNNNSGFLSSFSPILMQSPSPTNGGLPSIKREIHLLDEEETRRSNEDDNGIILSASSPYPGEILIESPETGRLVPLKLEEHEASAQLVYVSAEGLPATTYYKHDFPEGPTEFIDMVSWWDQDPGRFVALPGHHHHHHHHHVTQHQQHQAMGSAQQRLAHV